MADWTFPFESTGNKNRDGVAHQSMFGLRGPLLRSSSVSYQRWKVVCAACTAYAGSESAGGITVYIVLIVQGFFHCHIGRSKH